MPNSTNLLWNNPTALDGVTFGLSFISDDELRELMRRRYAFYEMAYPSAHTMRFVLQRHADIWQSYYEEIYSTTQYEYNPIHNYDMDESTDVTETRDLTDTTESDGTGTTSTKPYNTTSLVDTSEVTSNSSGTSGHNGTITTEHHVTRSGNIGVTTTQRMIEWERKIKLNMTNFVLDHFRDFFMLTM